VSDVARVVIFVFFNAQSSPARRRW